MTPSQMTASSKQATATVKLAAALLRLGEFLGAALLAPFYAAGWLAGSAWKLVRLAWAAAVVGFKAGNRL